MMHPLSGKLDFSPEAIPLPHGVSEELYQMCREIDSPHTAKEVFETLQPLLKNYRADKNLAIACGLLVEKQKDHADVGSLWGDIQNRFPEDAFPLRMLMRWYRRDGRTAEGINHIRQAYPNRHQSLSEAKAAILGFSEVKAWYDIDETMDGILERQLQDRAILMAYIKVLNDQSRYPEAAYLAGYVAGRDRMGTASQKLLQTVEQKADVMAAYKRNTAAELIDDIISLASAPRPFVSAEKLVFFSGQLGTGGAERQMTRIASAYRARSENGQGPVPEVWVKHANPETGGDFYRPMLREADVKTVVMTEEREVAVTDLDDVTDTMKELLETLAPDMRRHTAQLIARFREHETDVAYLWQDGGIVQSALAAIIAGVPRIITSFRGLPPNLRPHFFREELPVLYAALARLPHVTLTANSQKSADAYEEWLNLAPGTVVVIPNAIPPVLPDGDYVDEAYWEHITSLSPECSKTVLGVFRFDENKRPFEWIDAAARYIEQHDDTRFVMLGNGVLSERCAARIAERGLADRIFLAGIRSNVGFYMHKADLLMHLAQMEGLPNVLIEAQMAGTPVLATPAGGTSEVVLDGSTGVLLSQAEHLPLEELDRELHFLLSHPDVLGRFGEAAREYTGERFLADTILDRTAKLFNPNWRIAL